MYKLIICGVVLSFCAACANTTNHTQDEQSVMYSAPKQTLTQPTYRHIKVAQTPAPKQKQKGVTVVQDVGSVKRVRTIKKVQIDMDVRQADIRDILALIARQGQVNIVVDDDIKGQLTLSVKNTRLDQVFLMVMQTKNLGYTTRGNIIHVVKRASL